MYYTNFQIRDDGRPEGSIPVVPVSATYKCVDGAKDSPYVITSTIQKDQKPAEPRSK